LNFAGLPQTLNPADFSAPSSRNVERRKLNVVSWFRPSQFYRTILKLHWLDLLSGSQQI